MTVLNDMARFHLVMDAIDRLPQTGEAGLELKVDLRKNLIKHRAYIYENGRDMFEARDWKWSSPNTK